MNNLLTRQLRTASGLQRAYRTTASTPLLTKSFLRSPPAYFSNRRGAASNVSSKPGSQSLEHAATNIKEELGNSAGDLAKVIAAANHSGKAGLPGENPIVGTFLGVTKNVAGQVPKPVLYFGLAGALPYLGTAGTSVYLANQASQAASGAAAIDPGVAITLLHQALETQVTYGAVMLSFLGALHWGMEFAKFGGEKGAARLALGTAPILYAWPTLLLDPIPALIAQWAGFTGLWFADSKVTNRGWAPQWYSQYRFYLSILVGTCIIGTLAGTSAFGPVAGNNLTSHDLNAIREERAKYRPDHQTGRIVAGDYEATPLGEKGDHFTILRDIKEKKEEDTKQQQENEKEQK